MVEPSCFILDRSFFSLRTWRRTVPQPFSHVTTKYLHLCALAFLNNQQDPSPGQKAWPSTCTWKLWSRHFLIEKLLRDKRKDLAAVSKEQFILSLLDITFADLHDLPGEHELSPFKLGPSPSSPYSIMTGWMSLKRWRKKSPGGGQWL